MKQFFQSKDGKYSMMRLLVFIGAICSTFLIISGGIQFMVDKSGAEIVGIGAGIMGAVLGGKFLQQKSE